MPEAEPIRNISWYVGLDLGKQQDPSALVAAKRTELVDLKTKRPVKSYVVPHIQRWPLGTTYPTIVKDTNRFMAMPKIAGAVLVVDGTGVGQAVVDMFREAGALQLGQTVSYSMIPVMITGGKNAIWHEGDLNWNVAKIRLVSVMQALISSELIKVVPTLELAKTLEREIKNFKVKITEQANETFAAWRAGEHDDIVLALAVAMFIAEKCPAWLLDAFRIDPKGGLGRIPEGLTIHDAFNADAADSSRFHSADWNRELDDDGIGFDFQRFTF
jgi:hypothetical protein